MSNNEDLSLRSGWRNRAITWQKPPVAANDNNTADKPAPLSSVEQMGLRVQNAALARQALQLDEINAPNYRERAMPNFWRMVCNLLTKHKKPTRPHHNANSALQKAHRPRSRPY